MQRDDAWNLVCQYTASESLRRHMLAVEGAMRAYARRFDESEETWGSVCCTTLITSDGPILPIIRCRVRRFCRTWESIRPSSMRSSLTRTT